MQYPARINGNDYTFGSITLKVNNDVFFGFTEITYADKLTRTKGYGAGRHRAPTRRGGGKYEVDPCKIKGYLRDVRLLRQSLARQSKSGSSLADVPIQVDVQFLEDNDAPHHHQIEDCLWSSENDSSTEGPDLLMVEFEIDPMRIRRDGICLWDNSEGGVP